MSHCITSKVSAGAFDATVLDDACKRLNLPLSKYGSYNIEGRNVPGHAVQLPGFTKPAVFNDEVVIDAKTGRPALDVNGHPQKEVRCHWDNWNWRMAAEQSGGAVRPGYADKAPVERLQKEYDKVLDDRTSTMVRQVREIARRNNQATSLKEEADGVQVLTVSW